MKLKKIFRIQIQTADNPSTNKGYTYNSSSNLSDFDKQAITFILQIPIEELDCDGDIASLNSYKNVQDISKYIAVSKYISCFR